MIDRLAALPQVWLFVFGLTGVLIGWSVDLRLPLWVQYPGWLVFAAGVVLMIWAAVTMGRARTTFMPGLVPTRLVTWGPFALSRNPIYLGDLLILAGFLLIFDAFAGLIMVPLFAIFLTQRFIQEEEAMGRQAFGAEYDAYAARVHRWIRLKP